MFLAFPRLCLCLEGSTSHPAGVPMKDTSSGRPSWSDSHPFPVTVFGLFHFPTVSPTLRYDRPACRLVS